MFKNCTSLTSVDFGDESAVAAIGYQTFIGCGVLVEIEIPPTVISIEKYAFSDCVSLTSVVIPDSVQQIGQAAFLGCTKLASVSVGNGVRDFGGDVFSGSRVTPTVYGDGQYYGNATNPYVVFVACTGRRGAAIHEDTKTLADGAFSGKKMQTVTLPAGLVAIGDSCFLNCSRLTEISLPENIEYIGDKTFSGCTALKSITLSEKLTSIGRFAFENCTSLTCVTIPDSVTMLDGCAFTGCLALEMMVLGSGVKTISEEAFGGCAALSSVYYKGDSSAYAKIEIGSAGNELMTGATRYYYSEVSRPGPLYYWHYDADGKPVIW